TRGLPAFSTWAAPRSRIMSRFSNGCAEHDPEKWEPVFRKDHAPVKSMILKKPAPDLIRGGNCFSEKIMLL
ncbi:MAG TPA: hypothetical protein VIH65_04775, partial [Xanthobacteraceae bacterium]